MYELNPSKEYKSLSTLLDMGKAITTLGAHAVLGFLPEQEKLEKNISWYDASAGVELTSSLEVIAGILGFFVDNNLASFAMHCSAGEAILGRYGSINQQNGLAKHPNVLGTEERLGSLYLEVPYRFIKNQVLKVENKIRDIK